MFTNNKNIVPQINLSGCGYVCPQCEGKGFLDDGEVCSWCGTPIMEPQPEPELSED